MIFVTPRRKGWLKRRLFVSLEARWNWSIGSLVMRLEGKVAVITGAGQSQGESIGNGRAAAILFAREGAKLVLANRSMASLEGTRDLLRKEGFYAECMAADISNEN